MSLTTQPRTETRTATEPTPPHPGRRSTWMILGWVAVAGGLLATVVLAALVIWPSQESAHPAVHHSVSIRAIEGAEANRAGDGTGPGSPSIRAIEGAEGGTAPGSPSIRAIEGAERSTATGPDSPSIRAVEGAEADGR